MIKYFLLCILSLFSKLVTAQNVNMVIQINDKLIRSEISGLRLVFDSGLNRKTIPVGYIPGELLLNDSAWKEISIHPGMFALHFDYTDYSKRKYSTSNFDVDLTLHILQQRYFVLNVYDFSDRKYRNWYQYITDKNYLVEIEYPGRGKYIRQN
jgi:hypothetical protein